jgi:quercetin dioxygenase-like cupin family protein
VVVRVIEGSVVAKVDDNPETTYKEGDNFYEPPNGTHAVSRNASDTVPARILATFVCDSEGPLSKAPPVK